MFANKRIGFLGAGSMAEAIIAGILNKKLVTNEQLIVSNKSDQHKLQRLQTEYRIAATRDQEALARESDIIILAMKPKDVADIQTIKGALDHRPLIISVLAGISTDCISDLLNADVPVIRTMPNTSSAVGYSATGLSAGKHAKEEHIAMASAIFGAIGKVVCVEEEQLNIVTGLSGSGPAFIYYMVEAMEEAGIQAGLDAETSRELTYQTLMGAAQMLHQTGEEPSELRRKIMSPGGTTVAGLDVLSSRQFQESLKEAVHRAAARAKELGDMLSGPVKSR